MNKRFDLLYVCDGGKADGAMISVKQQLKPQTFCNVMTAEKRLYKYYVTENFISGFGILIPANKKRSYLKNEKVI